MDENSVIIKDDVILDIIRKALSSSDGIASGDGGKSIMKTITGKKNKAITFARNDNRLNINVDMTAEQGKSIIEKASALQKRVYDDVEAMSGLECESVTVNVSDIEINENDESYEGERK